jgi:hypothetical protein
MNEDSNGFSSLFDLQRCGSNSAGAGRLWQDESEYDRIRYDIK